MSCIRRGALSLVLGCALLVGREGPTGVRAQAPSTPVTASGALQRGITLMEIRGDCSGALPHFDVASRATDGDVAAPALFYRGRCLERLSRLAEALSSYERQASRFPAHPLTREARLRVERLTANNKATAVVPSLTLRRLDVADPTPTGSLSADGRYLAFHEATGVPFRRDMQTGRAEKLTLGGGEIDATRAWVLLLSRDGQQVAYTWADDRQHGELRIAPAVTGGPAKTLIPAGDLQVIRPVAWSADGRILLVLTTDAAFRIALRQVDIQSRQMDLLADLGFVEPFAVSLSPNGRHVLFDHSAAPGPRDIVLFDLGTRQASPIVTHGANDAMPVFLPDGRGFLFASDRLGPLSLWRQSLDKSQVSAEPILVRRDIGRIWAMGVTHNGTFVHGLQTGMIDVFTVRLGDDGRVAEQAAPVSATFAGYNQAPDWSPDGKSLVYASTRGAFTSGPGSRALVIRDHATGQERYLYPDMTFFNAPRWSHDGTRVVVKGRDASTNRWGLYIVDARTAAVTPVVVANVLHEESDLGAHQWVPGREAILLARHGKGIVEVDLDTGAETMLVEVGAASTVTVGGGASFAPDGRTLAWSVREQSTGGPPRAALRVRDANGHTRDLLQATSPDWLMLMDWAPDGKSVFVVRQFAARPGATPTRTELWRVPIDGSPPVSTALTAHALRGVSVHPDGKTIAYVSGFPTWEIWALEGIR